MLDTTVKFKDVSAETIAMEFVQFEDTNADTLAMEHFDDMRSDLGMQSIWDIRDGGSMSADQALLRNREYKVVYEYVRADATIEDLNADLKDGGKRSSAQVSSFAIDGKIKSLWAAADSCIKQSGTHHMFIENFEVQDDGTLLLETGS